jgi:hypothetical protein
MAFSYDQLEDSLVAYLAPLMPNTVIEAWPENEAWQEVKDKPVIYVCYSESSFNPSMSTDFVKQEEKPVIQFSIRGTKRKGPTGLNQVVADLKKYLQGIQITGTGCDRLQLESVKVENRDLEKQTWNYVVFFSTKKMQMQFIDDSEIPVANLQQVTFIDQILIPQ